MGGIRDFPVRAITPPSGPIRDERRKSLASISQNHLPTMNFFQPETDRALLNFVSKFKHSSAYEQRVVEIIREFAGGDDVGLVLGAILKKFEASFGNDFPPPPFRYDVEVHGRINGKDVLIKLRAPGMMGVHQLLMQWDPEDIIEVLTSGPDDDKSLFVTSTTYANWNELSRRKCLTAALLVHWRDNRCKYCDELIVDEGMCESCSMLINMEKCIICMSRCGCIEHKQLKRGRNEPKVHYHKACKKRKLDMF